MVISRREKARKEERKKSSVDRFLKNHKNKFESTIIKTPKSIKQIKLDQGTYRFDVIPYIAGPDNPDADEGEEHWCRVFGVRKGIGEDGKRSYVCPSQGTFAEDKEDFIADWISDNRATAGEYIKTLKVQKKIMMFVKDVTEASPQNAETQVLLANFGYDKYPDLGVLLFNKLSMMKKYRNFSDLKEGLSLLVKVEEIQPPGFKQPFLKVTSIEMDDRDYEYDDEERDKLPSLDSLLIVPSYDEMKDIFLKGAKNDEEDEDDKENDEEDEDEDEEENLTPKKRGRNPKKEEDEESEDIVGVATSYDIDLSVGDFVNYHFKDEDDDEYDIELELTKISADGTSLTGKDADGRVYKGIGIDEVAKIRTADEDEDEEESEEDEDEEEKPIPKKMGRKPKKEEDEEDPFAEQ